MNREFILEKVRETYFYKWYKKNFYETSPKDYNQDILSLNKIDTYFEELLLNDNPVMISRIGSTELRILQDHYMKRAFSNHNRHTIEISSGVFPTDDDTLHNFAKLNLERIKDIDLLGVWFNPFEDIIANEFCPKAKLTKLRNLEPYFSTKPWSYYLKGKKVLVIHPFVESIKLQYSNRLKIFKDPKVLPEFTLINYKPIQSFAGMSSECTEFDSWFSALKKMENDILEIDFDIAIVAAGAYGLPLASFIKNMGKKAIHLGGATQILFGISGSRWEKNPDFQNLINKNWIKPTDEEKPTKSHLLGSSSYW